MRRGKKQFHFEHQIIVQIIEFRRASSSGLAEDATGIRFPISALALVDCFEVAQGKNHFALEKANKSFDKSQSPECTHRSFS